MGTFGGFGGGGSWGSGFSRVTFSGVFGASAGAPFERWSFRLHTSAALTAATRETVATACRDAWVANIAARTTVVARLTEVKVASLTLTGVYAADPAILVTDNPGTSTAVTPAASQVALALSLTSATRGPRGRGRLFLPAPSAVPVNADGLITVASRDSFATSAKAFLDAVNASLGAGPPPGRIVIPNIAGDLVTVTGVRVGRRLDVIRSRAAQNIEAYNAALALA